MPNKLYIALDIGGTKTVAALFSASGKSLEQIKIKTDYQEYSELLDLIAALWQNSVQAIGVGIAGSVDQDSRFRVGPNLPKHWDGLEMAKLLSKRFHCPAMVDNDANCFTLGEAYFGAAKGKRHVLGITVGTGVGGGLVLDSHLYRGSQGAAGEIGHMTVAGNERVKCGCGGFGHLEALAAGKAITNRFRKLSGKKLAVREISSLARQGNRYADKAIREAGQWLGIGLSSAAHLLNPEVIVVGGGLVKTNGLLNAAKKSFQEHSPLFPSIKKTPIIKSSLGTEANLLGALRLAMTEAEKYR